MGVREEAIVKKIRLETGKKINTMFSGEYKSAFKGNGLSFENVREYNSGDDIRSIDWNVSSRMNHLYIKEYIEERELSIMLMVDISGSTDFGSTNLKRDVILEFVSLMLWLAQMNRDRVSLLLFSDVVEKFFRPRKGRKYVLEVIDEIIKCEPKSRGTDLAQAVDFVQKVMKKKSVVFVISDFLDSQDYVLRLKRLARKHDVIPVQILDPVERRNDFLGLLEFTDMETGETFMYDAIPGENNILQNSGFQSISLSTDEPIEKPLLRFFEQRNKSKLI